MTARETLIAKLEAATEGSRNLDLDVAGMTGPDRPDSTQPYVAFRSVKAGFRMTTSAWIGFSPTPPPSTRP